MNKGVKPLIHQSELRT